MPNVFVSNFLRYVYVKDWQNWTTSGQVITDRKRCRFFRDTAYICIFWDRKSNSFISAVSGWLLTPLMAASAWCRCGVQHVGLNYSRHSIHSSTTPSGQSPVAKHIPVFLTSKTLSGAQQIDHHISLNILVNQKYGYMQKFACRSIAYCSNFCLFLMEIPQTPYAYATGRYNLFMIPNVLS